MQATLKGNWLSNESHWPKLVLVLDDGSKTMARAFFAGLKKWEAKDGEPRAINVSLSAYFKPRSVEQNRTHRGLVSILAWQTYAEHGWEQVIHEQQLVTYGSQAVNEYTGELLFKKDGDPVMLRSSEMNTKQMARIVEGDFVELALAGVPMEHAAQYHNYWIEWRAWRAAQKDDPIAHATVEEKRAATPFCEACLHHLGPAEGNMAHIVSGGSGGADTPDNFIHLCPRHHREQHAQGWTVMLREFPHLAEAIARARTAGGKGDLISDGN